MYMASTVTVPKKSKYFMYIYSHHNYQIEKGSISNQGTKMLNKPGTININVMDSY